MFAGGISETIMHFVGYLRIIDDIARDRVEYDGASNHAPAENYVAKHLDYNNPINPDDIEIGGVGAPQLLSLDDLHFDRALPVKLRHAAQAEHPDDSRPHTLPDILHNLGGGGGASGGGAHIQISVTYQAGGEQDLLDVLQINRLSNDDVIGDGAFAAQAHALSMAAQAVIMEMAENANAHIPQAWWMPHNDTGATLFLTSHDQAWAAHGGVHDPHSVQPGYYLNGELQHPAPDALTSPSVPPSLDQVISHAADALTKQVIDVHQVGMAAHGQQIGQWAELGGNLSLNGALVVDLTQSARTMIVEGDYFKTNAIFQTNSLVDHNHFTTTGGTALPALTGGDTMNNIANFVQHPGIYATVPAHWAGPNWSVDVVHGNYYNIHAVTQINYLSNNDVVAQNSDATHYEIHAGGNTLANLTQILDGNVHYDLIVVAGAYHGMNVIFQNNILLTVSEIKMIADGVNASQSHSDGHNALSNEATIDNYGGNNFHPTNAALDGVVKDVAGGATSLDPHAGLAFDGSGGTIHVLYVTGDYYDVNAIWQTNVTSDVNVMVQLIGAPPPGLAAALHQDGTVSQSAVTGQDSLLNKAAIIDVGPTNTYVGGHIYTDAVLVQANLLPDVKSATLAGDTHTLVPELVAFVTDSQDASHTHAAPATTSPAPHEDPMASVMH